MSELKEKELLTVKQFCARYKGKWPTESALRAIILDAAWGKNSFQKAFKRVNRRVLVDVNEFWRIIENLPENTQKKM